MTKIYHGAIIAIVSGFPAVSHSAELSGAVNLSLKSLEYGNSDDSESGSHSGFEGSAFVDLEHQGWRLTLDVNQTERSVLAPSDDFDSFAPESARALGLHAGRQFGGTYVGSFWGQNRFQGADATTMNG